MHDIEPHYNWRSYYIASEDSRSPFYGREYSEFEFTDRIYNFLIHPQWDNMGSSTLFIKILYVDYENGSAIIEMIGEWNDLLNNDIMILKRDIVDELILQGIYKFLLIGENVLSFHASEEDYYEEWFEEVENGWIVGLNFQSHVIQDMKAGNLDYYINLGGQFENFNWTTYKPQQLVEKVNTIVNKRLREPSY